MAIPNISYCHTTTTTTTTTTTNTTATHITTRPTVTGISYACKNQLKQE